MIQYTLVRKKIKNVYISIKDGQVIVRAPMRLSLSKIEELLKLKKEWIEEKLGNIKENRKVDIKNKNYIYILGSKIKIEYVYDNIKNIKVNLTEKSCIVHLPNNIKMNPDTIVKIEEKIDKELKSLAIKYIGISMEKYEKITSLHPVEIKVRKFKSIWGNCSSKKVIKINQNLIHYDIPQIEYVCLHEITHLKYMNHQKEFWNYIKKYMPQYKEISQTLKK